MHAAASRGGNRKFGELSKYYLLLQQMRQKNVQTDRVLSILNFARPKKTMAERKFCVTNWTRGCQYRLLFVLQQSNKHNIFLIKNVDNFNFVYRKKRGVGISNRGRDLGKI